jgi:Ca2+-dependent lipid-binding protein
MLEDAMQASLPKLVKGVRVADFGQGNESVRILGIRWLEAGDAAEEKNGMLGEEGDFANFEIAVAYRSRPTENSAGRALKKRSRNAHLLIEFWSVGGLRLPVWVEVTGFLATARVRMQLTPNPPFLRTAIITLLGQPKVNVSCVPIAKNFLNIMDIPVMNKFLQSSIDQAISNYVAPRSLTLDLKTLLTGAEKMDTDALGVLVVRVISAEGFKDGDGGKKWLSDAKKRGDPYVTVGWGKWGKGMWNTRWVISFLLSCVYLE